MKVTVRGELHDCSDCGSTHLGRSCGGTFAARLRSQRLDPSWMPTKSLHRYWDQDALDNQFGEDATERSLELTEGRGFNGPVNQQDVAKLFE